jgi:mono/diheme cytochrome c family protein
MTRRLILGFAMVAFGSLPSAECADYARDVLPVLQKHCFTCHADADGAEGGFNLERFRSDADVMRDRQVWAAVYDKVESLQMPPPKESSQPTAEERRLILEWIADIAARPDPQLGTRDPGKPVLRRLTRLEYNNTVRDLLGLEIDVFMFPERLPLADRSYFSPANGKFGDQLEVKLREYGAKYPVLLPNSGLPADNRAEHGYRNWGEAGNFDALTLEKYVTLAGEIVNNPTLPQRSSAYAALLGIDPPPLVVTNQGKSTNSGSPVSPAVGVYAPNIKQLTKATGSADNVLGRFFEDLGEAFSEGTGGVFDVAAGATNSTVAGKGATIRVPFGNGAKTLTINPNEDLWLVSFATAEAVSGNALIANKVKNAKKYELTFKLEGGDEDEGVVHVGVCVVGRKGQSGDVVVTARLTDDTETKLTAHIAAGPTGTTFFSFMAHPGELIKSLVVDGSQFSGDYVLIDDIGFITNGRPLPKSPPQPPTSAQTIPQRVSKELPPPQERLKGFLERAFRSNVDDEEFDRYFSLFEASYRAGKSEADAMRVAVQAVLSSPRFLYLAEHAPAGEPAVQPLGSFELANRLAYFLWASMPDDELLSVARSGALQDSHTLETQTRRMLRDPRARELAESFATQWLRLDQLYTAKPDAELFKSFYAGPQGKDTLHGAQLIEVLLLFETVMVEERSILEFIDADYTWLNPRLRRLYGLDAANANPTSDAPLIAGQPTREIKPAAKDQNHLWTRVKLADKTRGGFVTMAGPLTVTSLPFRTSPVKRGAWLLETIFHRPPTEPKVAFAINNDTKESAAAQSIRQRFEQHRSQPACYSCHIRLDPPGFALERFDAIGAYRDRDGSQPVDARGEWNGRSFDGPTEFKAALMSRPDEFTRGFIEHLLGYALSRRLTICDLPAVTQIEATAKADEYHFDRIVLEIVKSYPFRYVRK